MNINRRQFLTILPAAAIVLYAPASDAVLLPIILPPLIAGIFSIWTLREQNEQSVKMHRDQMAMNQANLILSRERFAWDVRQAQRSEELQLILAGKVQNEHFAQTLFAERPIFESLAFDNKGWRVSAGIAENCDGKGTFLALDNGEIAVERSGYGGKLTNAEAVKFGNVIRTSGDTALAVPIGLPEPINGRLTKKLAEVFAEEKNFPNTEAFHKKWALVATRSYSNARRVTANGANLNSVAMLPRYPDQSGNRPLEFHYT